MPKYRALHTRMLDSFDVNDMPDDSHRYMWNLLFLIVDREGRGIDDPCWIRSRAYPLRNDVTIEQIESRMEWLTNRGMVRRYEVNGRKYFDITKFVEYQPGTLKEAPSSIPSYKESLRSSSGVAPEEVQSNSALNAYADADLNADAYAEQPTTPDPFKDTQHAIEKITGMPVAGKAGVDAINEIIAMGATPEDIGAAYTWYTGQGNVYRYPASLVNPTRRAMAERIQKDNKWVPGEKQKTPQRTRDKPNGGYEVLPDQYKDWAEFDAEIARVRAHTAKQKGANLGQPG